jgi:hypothetical protein
VVLGSAVACGLGCSSVPAKGAVVVTCKSTGAALGGQEVEQQRRGKGNKTTRGRAAAPRLLLRGLCSASRSCATRQSRTNPSSTARQTRKGTSACSSHPLLTHPRLEARASACWLATATPGVWRRLGCHTVDAPYDQGSGGGSTVHP